MPGLAVPLLTFVLAAAAIVVAGSYLAKFADRIAELTGLGRLLIGSVLLAGATSLPELTVDVTAVRLGFLDLALGDLLGSSLMNLLILAMLDLSHHSQGKMLSRVVAGHALSGAMSIALTSAVGLAILCAPFIPQWSLGNFSLPSIAILVAYLLGVRVVYLDQRISMRAAIESGTAVHPAVGPLWIPAAGFAAAAGVILFAGPYLARSAGELADLTGLGKTFFGTTVVAFCTSLPELVASLAALRMGSFDLAVGNIFGSNTFNMILLLPLDAIHPGSLYADVSSVHVISCLATVLVTAVAMMGQLYQVENRRRLIEPDAVAMLLLIFATLWLVYRAA